MKLKKIKKTAQKKIDPIMLMSSYITHLRALYAFYQECHWLVSGSDSYGNHLLFERLYNGTNEILDEAAEKSIGVFGGLKQGDFAGIAKKYMDMVKDKSAKSLVETAIKAEKDFQDLAKNTYEMLKESNILTLGLDDMIMSHASKSEVHVYLLRQVLG